MNSSSATVQDPVASKLEAARSKMTRYAIPAGAASGLLLWIAFPPVEWNAVAWVALALYSWLITVRERPRITYLGLGSASSFGSWLSSGSR